jgi:hypothetical protein
VSQALVAHAYNPSYSGCRDQENQGLKPAQAKQFLRPCLKKNHHKKRAGGVSQGESPDFTKNNHNKRQAEWLKW